MSGRKILMGGIAGFALSLALAGNAFAADVSDLGSSLTPIGAERAGNAEGTIPAWTGGDVTPVPGWKTGDPRVDPYAGDAKLFSIDASNVDQYADRLSPGQVTIVKRYDGYRMDVYPTHRSCGYSQDIYDATKANVGRAKLSEQGGILAGFGGFLYPLPENGLQAIANYRTAYYGKYTHLKVHSAISQTGGNFVHNIGIIDTYSPFYETNARDIDNRYMTKFIYKQIAPAASVGGIIMTLQPYDDSNESWVYIPGLRRVKKAPTANYDTPGQDDIRTFDQTYMYNGLPDRYDWKLVGKQELFVPYNASRLRAEGLDVSSLITDKYPNRDLARYELHRVWVVEATVKAGWRNTFSKRVFYLDEDTWAPLVADLYDTKGKIWRFQENHIFMAPEVPACMSAADFYHDLNADRYVADNIIVESADANYTAGDVVDNDMFSPDAMRRYGRR
ncbi:MAG: DUF1329 domain-containing protein [Alphaproteobacteria bacterium HGW-Alphaproteobacteria-12]|nr:MAG: DUF1329 domain-containing protein [Alphaproteobacteria bacterium HGW-Alphaproteobacteria-12]